jgi:hypothetical protein
VAAGRPAVKKVDQRRRALLSVLCGVTVTPAGIRRISCFGH